MERKNNLANFQVMCVLQKRHLPDEPVEYLIKGRHANLKRLCERWIPVDELLATEVGAQLVELFEQSKVGLQAVDAHLPKRRSLGQTCEEIASIDNQRLHSCHQYHNSVAPASCTTSHQSSGAVSSTKCLLLSKPSCSKGNNSISSAGAKAAKLRKALQRRTLLKKDSKLHRSLRSRLSTDTDAVSCSENGVDSAITDDNSNVHSDCESDDDIRYSLVEDSTTSGCQKDCQDQEVTFSGDDERNLKKSNSKLKVDHFPVKRQNKSSIAVKKRQKRDSVEQKSLCIDPEIQFKIFDSSVISMKQESRPEGTIRDVSAGATSLSSSSNKQTQVTNRVLLDDEVHEVSPNLPSSACHKKGEPGSDAYNVNSTSYYENRRTSIRQSELVYRFKEIVVRKWPGYVQLSLVTRTTTKNALNPKVFQELTDALRNAQFDDSRVVLLTGSGSVFCSGIDLHFLLSGASDRRSAAKQMADSLRDFIHALTTFPKPIIAAVNGPAVGVGVAILALCDIVYASDKASFSCPYAKLCQTPEGCSSYTLPKIVGIAMANELLLCGRKITAVQACQAGLVSQVFWPTNMMQEVIPRVQSIAAQSAKVMEATKALVQCRRRSRLEQVNMTECHLLSEYWATTECQRAIQMYIDTAHDV